MVYVSISVLVYSSVAFVVGVIGFSKLIAFVTDFALLILNVVFTHSDDAGTGVQIAVHQVIHLRDHAVITDKDRRQAIRVRFHRFVKLIGVNF